MHQYITVRLNEIAYRLVVTNDNEPNMFPPWKKYLYAPHTSTHLTMCVRETLICLILERLQKPFVHFNVPGRLVLFLPHLLPHFIYLSLHLLLFLLPFNRLCSKAQHYSKLLFQLQHFEMPTNALTPIKCLQIGIDKREVLIYEMACFISSPPSRKSSMELFSSRLNFPDWISHPLANHNMATCYYLAVNMANPICLQITFHGCSTELTD